MRDMLRRRLTALLASLLLLPSTVIAGGDGCAMGTLVVSGEPGRIAGHPSAHDHGHAAHSSGRHAHGANTDAILHEADPDLPFGVPHAPDRCVLAVGCGAAVIAAVAIPVDEPVHVAGRVEASVVLTPDSPARGLEPPPPRA